MKNPFGGYKYEVQYEDGRPTLKTNNLGVAAKAFADSDCAHIYKLTDLGAPDSGYHDEIIPEVQKHIDFYYKAEVAMRDKIAVWMDWEKQKHYSIVRDLDITEAISYVRSNNINCSKVIAVYDVNKVLLQRNDPSIAGLKDILCIVKYIRENAPNVVRRKAIFARSVWRAVEEITVEEEGPIDILSVEYPLK